VGLILCAILHAIPDQDNPYGIVARLRDTLYPGSYVAISHSTADARTDEARAVEKVTSQTATPTTLRTRAEIVRFFDGFELVEPGVVWVSQWRPDTPEDVGDHPERMITYAGVGRRT
jgi:hypothetical protein